MKVRLWGVRGSLAVPGPENMRVGGNTSCVEVQGPQDECLILDAGSGILRLGQQLLLHKHPIHILLTHLHLDHILGLGFFPPMYDVNREIHLWGPASTTMDLRERLSRYLSPPLFPVRLRDLPCKLILHSVPACEARVGELQVSSWLVAHPGPTVGYRISDGQKTIAYLPDHEPVLGAPGLSLTPDWISGFDCADSVDLLIHDSQYSDLEYDERVGWGHSSYSHALEFARRTGVGQLVFFHHDPSHDDSELDSLVKVAVSRANPQFPVTLGCEGWELVL